MRSIPFSTEGIDPNIAAYYAVSLASSKNHPVYWVHEGLFRFHVKPQMSVDVVFKAFVEKLSYAVGVVVRCIDESIEDHTQLMSKIDSELRSHNNIARFLTCCDAETDCSPCLEESNAKPYQLQDGTFLVALQLPRPGIKRAVKRILFKYQQQIEIVDELSYVGEVSRG